MSPATTTEGTASAGVEAAFRVEGLTVSYGGVTAVSGVSLGVAAGEIAGLIGPNGAGKTSLIDAVSGFTAAAAGVVELGGRDVSGEPPSQRARLGLARTFQSLDLFDDLIVSENLALACDRPSAWSTLTDLVRPKRLRHSQVDEVLDLVGLADVASARPAELSNGQRHLVALARAVVAEPSFLLLDEPAAGLDSSETAVLGGVLRALRERGMGVLLVEHDMALVLDVCDVVHVLDQGRLIASGSPPEVRRNPAVIEAYLGTSAP